MPSSSAGSPPAGTGLVTNLGSPQPLGLEWPRPGISVFQTMFFPDSPFHSMGGDPAPEPPAEGPRNWGQFGSAARAARDNTRIVENFIASYSIAPVRPPETAQNVRFLEGVLLKGKGL